MAVKYKLLQTRGSLPKNAEFRVVTTCNETVGLKPIQKHIEQATALTPSDVAGTLIALQEEMVYQLQMGNRVHLPGLGYFSVAATGDIYEDPRSGHYRLRNARVRTINFQPDKELIDAMRDTQFKNNTYHSPEFAVPIPQEVDAALDALFAEKPVITVKDLRDALQLSNSYAYKLITQLEKEGKLRNVGSRYRKLFVRD